MENSSQKLLPSLVLVGRPNVGKSTLFNRLTRSKNAIVANIAGLTRDRHYGIGKLAADKLGEYLVIDTGGFEPLVKEGILSEMAKQTEQAILEGDAILFLVDARNGITPHDKEIAAKLRRLQQERPVIVAINKSEGLDKNVICAEFYELGLGEPFTISATHGDGVRNVLDCIFKQLKQNFHDSHENSEKISENLVENSQNSQNSQNTEQTNQTNQTNNENPENSENPDKIVADDNENLTPEKIENVEVIPASDINWGRWKEITDKPIQIDLQNLDPQSIDFLAKNDYFAVFRNKGEWQRPLNNLQFALINSEAVLSEINGNISDAYVRAGGLNIDIANQRFDTNLSVEYKLSDQQKTKIQDFKAVGNLSNQGTFDSLAGFSGSTMSVNGALSHDNNEAAYIFQGRTFSNSASPNNQILGVTQWGIRK